MYTGTPHNRHTAPFNHHCLDCTLHGGFLSSSASKIIVNTDIML